MPTTTFFFAAKNEVGRLARKKLSSNMMIIESRASKYVHICVYIYILMHIYVCHVKIYAYMYIYIYMFVNVNDLLVPQLINMGWKCGLSKKKDHLIFAVKPIGCSLIPCCPGIPVPPSERSTGGGSNVSLPASPGKIHAASMAGPGHAFLFYVAMERKTPKTLPQKE